MSAQINEGWQLTSWLAVIEVALEKHNKYEQG
jgi:hypothetical protein